MDDNSIKCDVAIVGSGFAGSFIANELSSKGLKVVILEAGPGIQPNINAFMKSFYEASSKVPESPYPPAVFDSQGNFIDPATVAVGRPSSLTLGASSWRDPQKSYLDQTGKSPFKSTYERLAGGTSHWMGLTPRLVPNDFRMNTKYVKDQPPPKNEDLAKDLQNFVDWPIDYNTVEPFYQKAEAELGVAADVDEQRFCDIDFCGNYQYPMPKIPPSLFDQLVSQKLANLDNRDTQFLGMGRSVTSLAVRSLPAARNSQPYRNRRACAGNTSCIPICPIQAKYDPTITLNEATNNGARLIDHAVASEIHLKPQSNRVSGISYIKYDPKSGAKTAGLLEATVYVIAANGIETPRLLLMSNKQRPNGVANRSGMVGCNLMDHPQYLTWGLLPQPVFPYRGPLVTSAIGELCDGPFRAQRAAFRVSLGNEGWSAVVGGTGGDPNVTTLDFVNGMNSSGLNQKKFSQLAQDNIALLGNELANELSNLISRQFRIAFPIEQNPDPKNQVKLSDFRDKLGLQRPQIIYDISEYTKQGFAAAFRLKKLIFDKLGATDTEFTSVHPDDPAAFEIDIDGTMKRFTYGGAGHVMGTYRMGDDPKTSVVDGWQRSHDHPNLYLVGSGTFPTVGTANPTLTLSALALRTAQEIDRIISFLPKN
jgi:glucose dehydrogenase